MKNFPARFPPRCAGRPTFTRGDCGYGSEIIMLECEQRGLPYLFKLRHTAKVKELVTRMMRQGAETLLVPMSALGWHNLDAVCKRLEIPPAVWLQGVLHNLAHRCQKMREAHECALRNEHKRKS